MYASWAKIRKKVQFREATMCDSKQGNNSKAKIKFLLMFSNGPVLKGVSEDI